MTGTELERAIALAVRAHVGQVDKAGAPYILHPLRVMLRVSAHGPVIMAAAVLHDTVEDTAVTLDEIAAQVSPAVARIVERLTRRPGEVHLEYVRRAVADPDARLVKVADVEDNSDADRLAKLPPDQRRSLRKKYEKTLAVLRGDAATAEAEP